MYGDYSDVLGILLSSAAMVIDTDHLTGMYWSNSLTGRLQPKATLKSRLGA